MIVPILAGIISIGAALVAGLIVEANRRSIINNGAFMAQINRLVMANNVDRAIKLCNAAPTASLAKGVKALLTRANRVHQLELVYQEVLGDLGVQKLDQQLFLGKLLIGVIGAAGMAALLYVTPDLHYGFPALFFGSYIVSAYFSVQLATHSRQWAPLLVKVKNLLYSRRNYVPPAFKPRTQDSLTEEELQAWRASMDAFETDFTKQREAGLQSSASDEHDNLVQGDGVLPPL